MNQAEKQKTDWILAEIVTLAVILNFYGLWNEKYGNAYYTSAIVSMLQNFHNFFFASFDPGGFVTVDKPPVTFWIQTLSAYLFGVHGWSMILPQALANVGSVLLLYFLVKPTFGKSAARLSSLIMACTPIAVAVSRTNNIDSLLVFTLLFATWMLFRGIRKQNLYWMMGAFAMIGVGFNMKMLQAYMVVPAFYLFYLLAFKSTWKKKLSILAAATVLMVGISLSWAVVVDSIPQENRPYIGSSQTNSVLELALGYNGLSRLTGMNRGGMGPGEAPGEMRADENQNSESFSSDRNYADSNFDPGRDDRERSSAVDGPTPPNGVAAPQGRGGGGMFGTGQPGPFRLFQTELSGQASWLLPFVAFACVSLLAGFRLRNVRTAKQNETLFWMAWLLPMIVFFSVAGFFHHYYLIMLAPSIAALAGAGWVELWNQYRKKEGWKKWLLPTGIVTTTAFELYILQPFQKQIGIGWSIGIGALGIGLSLILFLAMQKKKLSSMAALAGMFVLLAGPLYWAATPLMFGTNSTLPQAGPSQQGFGQRSNRGDGPDSGINQKLFEYVAKNNTGEKYLFATTSSGSAAPYIIETGKPVMAMGGFSGSDPILTVEKLKQMIANKEVKYFLISSSGDGGFRGGQRSEVLEWIRQNGKEISKDLWQSDSSNSIRGIGMEGSMSLYKVD